MNRRLGIAALAVLVTGGTAALVLQFAGPVPTESPRDDAMEYTLGVASTDGQHAPREVSVGGVTAVAGRWRLGFDLAFEGPGVGDGSTTTRAKVGAVLSLTPGAEPGWVAGRLEGPVVEADPALVKPLGLAEGALGKDADLPFMWRVDAAGIGERRFTAEMPVGLKNMLSALASGLQVVGMAAGDGARWEADELGPGGSPVRATYERDGVTLTKTWHLEEGRSPDAPPGTPAPVVTDAKVVMELRAGRVVRATYALTLVADVSLTAEVANRYRSETHATLEAIDDGEAWAMALRPEQMVAEATSRPARGERSVHQRRVAKSDRTPAELLLASAEAHNNRDPRGRRALMKELAASMRADDRVVDEVARQLRGPLPDEADVRTMVEALGSAGTSHALAAMRAIIEDPNAPADQRRLVIGVTGWIDAPSTELLASLRARSLDLDAPTGPAALQALATQARRQQELDAPLAASLTSELTDRARLALGAVAPGAPTVPGGVVVPENPGTAPADDKDLVAWLDVLGTLGGADAWSLIEPYLDHATPRVRRTAVAALRFVDTAPAREALARVMATHVDQWTRREAIETVRYQRPAVFTAAVVRALMTDSHAAVRVAAAQTIAVWAYDEPALYDHIRAALEREVDPHVRTLYQGLLPRRHTDANEPTPTLTVRP